jgi:hypothetical protein
MAPENGRSTVDAVETYYVPGSVWRHHEHPGKHSQSGAGLGGFRYGIASLVAFIAGALPFTPYRVYGYTTVDSF